MKHILYLFTVLSVFTSCSNSPNNAAKNNVVENNVAETLQTKPLTLQDFKKDFTFFNLTKFEMDTFSWETRPKKYKELDSITFYMIWQDGKRKFELYCHDYLFSWQERDTNLIEFTILTDNEGGSWCNNITYFIFNKKGKLVNKFVVCSDCGDGGQVFYSYGKFINDKKYEMLCVGYEVPLLEEELIEGDSTLYHFIINDIGKVTKKEVFNKHFTQKDLKYLTKK